MSNWIKKIKTKARGRNKHEFRLQTAYNNMEFLQGISTKKKKGRSIYSMVIVPCADCGKKFRIHRRIRDALDKQARNKVCPICAKVPSKSYLMVSKKEEENIKRYHKAKNCVVRKMTKEERKKYIKN